MYCKHCETRSDETNARRRRTRRSRTLKCERCGTPIVAPAGDASPTGGTRGGTGAHLARFGLAITGDPLLELKREGT